MAGPRALPVGASAGAALMAADLSPLWWILVGAVGWPLWVIIGIGMRIYDLVRDALKG